MRAIWGQENSPVELEQRERVGQNEEIMVEGLELGRQLRAVSPPLNRGQQNQSARWETVKWPAVEKANYTGRKENSYTAVTSSFSEASLKAQAQAS